MNMAGQEHGKGRGGGSALEIGVFNAQMSDIFSLHKMPLNLHDPLLLITVSLR